MKRNACIITQRVIKIKTLIITVCCFLAAAALILSSAESIEGAKRGLLLCADIIIPSLFVFCVITSFILRSNICGFLGGLLDRAGRFLFGVNGNVTVAILLSIISGYPVGAKCIRLLCEQNQLTKKQAKHLICCCVNPGPAFVVLVVGQGILNSKAVGYVLFAASCICCLLINIIFKSKDPIIPLDTKQNKSYTNAFVDAVSDASVCVLSICAWVVLFSSLTQAASSFLPNAAQDVLVALCEITTAVISLRESVFAVAFALGWCGFSVHAQIFSVSGGIMPNYIKFVVIRIFNGLLLAGITELLLKIFKITLPVASITKAPVYSGTAASIPAAIALTLTCILFLFSCYKKQAWKTEKTVI